MTKRLTKEHEQEIRELSNLPLKPRVSQDVVTMDLHIKALLSEIDALRSELTGAQSQHIGLIEKGTITRDSWSLYLQVKKERDEFKQKIEEMSEFLISLCSKHSAVRPEKFPSYSRLDSANCHICLIEERDQLTAENEKLKSELEVVQVQRDGYENCYDAYKARTFRLEERVTKLREAFIKAYAGLKQYAYFDIDLMEELDEALAHDDELETNKE